MTGRGSRHHIALDRPLFQRVRRAVLDRDGWRCQRCKRYGNECDHRTPLRNGGAPYDMDNLQTLCRGCHIDKTRAENRRPPTPQELEWAAFVAELLPHRGAG